ncbi:MAG: hypothetical protein V4714_07745 [Bacteroidota bacterium]
MEMAKVYRIETDRLVIRCYEPSDAEKLKNAITESLDHLRPWMPWAQNEPEIKNYAIGIRNNMMAVALP